jgi:uroporphyrinogen-III synthase
MKIKNVLISQPKPADPEKSPYSQLAEKYKLNLDFQKFIKIEGVSSKEFRQSKIRIQDHTAVILTSRNAVDHFFRLCESMRVEVPDTMKYFCTSESTAYYLQKYVQYRKRKIFYGNQSLSELVEIIKKHDGEKFIIPTSDSNKKPLMTLLDKEKVKYTTAVMYKTLSSDLSKLDIDKYDLLVFFSPAGIYSLFENFPEFAQDDMLIAGFGPATKKAIKAKKLRLNIEAPTKTAPSMTMALEQFLEKEKKK